MEIGISKTNLSVDIDDSCKLGTDCEKRAISWSFVTVSGRFCRKRILLGGRYSSGIWTAGRLGAGAAVPPSTIETELIYEESGEYATYSLLPASSL